MTASALPRGIDVSAVGQGRFDWQPWEGHISFASAKCTEGLPGEGYTVPGSMSDGRDTEFARNWEHMAQLGLWRFAYHFGHPSLSPIAQARFLVETVTALGLHEGDNFVLDHEVSDGMNPVDVSFWAWTFTHEVNRLAPGHRCIVETNPNFARMGYAAKVGGWPLWIEDYGVPAPEIPPPWGDYVFWQDSCQVVCRDIFNGTEAGLKLFCTTTGPWSPGRLYSLLHDH